jgi:hypothetical protein
MLLIVLENNICINVPPARQIGKSQLINCLMLKVNYGSIPIYGPILKWRIPKTIGFNAKIGRFG